MTSGEPLREELRQADERVARLREENAGLERGLLRPTAPRNRLAMCLFAAAVSGSVGYVLATRLGHERLARESALTPPGHEGDASRLRAQSAVCKADLDRKVAELAACEKARMQLPNDVRKKLPCPCSPGDPLCSCL